MIQPLHPSHTFKPQTLTPPTEFDDGSAAATYLITPSFTCQNPSHSHHPSHFQPCYRPQMVDTVVEESTGGSIVTVIDTNQGRADDTNGRPSATNAMNIPTVANRQSSATATANDTEPMDAVATPPSLMPPPPAHSTPLARASTIDPVNSSDMMQSNEAGTELFTHIHPPTHTHTQTDYYENKSG